jgi:hypothetical protein
MTGGLVREADLVNRHTFAAQFKKIESWHAWKALLTKSKTKATLERLKAAGKLTLESFLKTTPEGRVLNKKVSALADDDSGRGECGYTAIGLLLDEMGLFNVVTQEKIAKFKENGAKRRSTKPSDLYGITLPVVKAFMKFLDAPVAVSECMYRGDFSVQIMDRFRLSDGFYLLAGQASGTGGGTGHVVFLHITGNGETVDVHDKDVVEHPKNLAEWCKTVVWMVKVSKVHVIE